MHEAGERPWLSDAAIVAGHLIGAAAEIERLRAELRLAQQWDEHHPAYIAGGKAAVWAIQQRGASLHPAGRADGEGPQGWPGDGWITWREFNPDAAFDHYHIDLAGHDGKQWVKLLGCSYWHRRRQFYGPRQEGRVGDPLDGFRMTHLRLRPAPE